MKRLLLFIVIMGLFHWSEAQVKSPVMTGSVTGRKVLDDKSSYTFNVGSAIPYFYKGSSANFLQIGFPNCVLYIDESIHGAPVFSNNLCNRIDFSWPAQDTIPDKIYVYEIYRDDVRIGETRLTSYSDKNPEAGKTHKYKVRLCTFINDDNSIFGNFTPESELALANISDISFTTSINTVYIAWSDNVINEDKIIVTRTNLKTGVATDFELKANSRQFADEQAEFCTPYKYRVNASNSCGSIETITNEVLLEPDLSNTFEIGGLTASKGYYPDIVHLEWTNINKDLINTYKIYRKEYGSLDSTLLTTLDVNSTNYDDRNALNGVLYEYSIKAELLCYKKYLYSNVVSDVGFKMPTGTVSGKVTYKNGDPTSGVTLTAESSEIPEFTSVLLDGNSSFMKILDKGIDIQNEFTFQAYVSFNKIKNAAIFNKGQQYKLNYINNSFVFDVGETPLTYQYTPPVNKFIQLTAVFNGTESFLYIDGKLKAHISEVTASTNNDSEFIIGQDNVINFFQGYIDEIRIWKTALAASDVEIYYNKYISGSEPGLIGYYRLNENAKINRFFDISKTGNKYNENHGISYNCNFVKTNPLIEQLWFRSVTNAKGDYLISGIPYLSGGSVYTIVPMMAPHDFNPTSKTLFLGESATIHNNVDFTDVSTVPVTLTVIYENTKFPVKEVWVKLDGQIIIDKDNKPIQTNEKGTVTFEVPIGSHYLSFEKQNHIFKEPFYPGGKDTAGNHIRKSFAEPVQIELYDITKVKLAGKIVGGPVEAEKDLLSIIDPTKNNLGMVNIELTTELGYPLDKAGNSTTVKTKTDPNTGYYEFELLPEVYKPNEKGSIKNKLYNFTSDDDMVLIDMSSKFIDIYEKDSIKVGGKFTGFDTTAVYNHRRDWIYRTDPEFSVSNGKGGKILSEPSFKLVIEKDTVTIPLAVEVDDGITYPFGKPIFLFGNKYELFFKAFEKYVNADYDVKIDTVPVTDGVLKITNNLALENKIDSLKLDTKGEARDTFLADFPNIASPYTQSLSISLEGTSEKWPAGNDKYEAYILGGIPSGNNFITTGPKLVDYILRDPPGSGSSATLQKGFSTNQTAKFSLSKSLETSASLAYMLGVSLKIQTGTPFFMVSTDIESENNIKGTIGCSLKGTAGYEHSTKLSFNETFSTSGDAGFVGSDGDVFIGHATNIVYGISNMIELMPKSEAKADDIIISSSDNKYAISKKQGLRFNPEFDTYFIYSQRIIEEENIPHLIKLRNLILESKNSGYTVNCLVTDLRYGSNNDDEIWGNAKSTNLFDGPSYKYVPQSNEIIDSVRYYNAQITGWKQILAINEKQKLDAKADENHKNISFGAGSTYTSSIGSEKSNTINTSFEFSLSMELALSLGFTFNDLGFKLETSQKNTLSTELSGSIGTTKTENVSYTLSDQDANNYITVDVLKCQSGNGPVFKTRGGQTSCPYEGEELTQFFEPGKHTLNLATMRIEGMNITVDNASSPLIPETMPAVFTLNLSNTSEAEKDGWYILKVDAASNTNGAKVKMDGSDINDGVSIFIPYGKTIKKTIEVWKGRSGIVEYEDLIISLGSGCGDGSKEVEISANFTEACSQIEFESPADGWIVNVADNDSLLIEISGYNLQHQGFENFHLQYSPKGTSNWTTVQSFTNNISQSGESNTTYLNNDTKVSFYWNMKNLPDRAYDIRLVSHCTDEIVNYSETLSGILDGQRPQVFGSPQPADGILNVDDDILVQFNEPIEGGMLTDLNFGIKGTLGGYPIKHDAFLRFNGTSDYSSIPEGISFNDKSFTIEFWVRPDQYENSVIFSQGNSPESSLEIGLVGDSTTYFKIGNIKYEATFDFTKVTKSEWQHLAYIYDYETGDIFIYQNDKIILEKRGTSVIVNNSGIICLGKSSVTGGGYFAGSLHELRIWSKIWSVGEIYANQAKALSGSEISLIGYWPVNEAYGTLAIDKAAYRHMEIFAPWVVDPGGYTWNFTGNNFLEFYTGYFAIIPEMDYTLEFWFKDNNPTDTVCLFSNQKGDGKEGDGLMGKALSIFATPDGKIWVASKGNVFEAVSNDYFDASWHHFAMVVRRHGNIVSLIDGQVQNEKENSVMGGIAGDKMYLGARKWDNINGIGTDWYYTGKLDEFRLWNLAKTSSQIRLDMNSKLSGKEIGLMVYLPFDGYSKDKFGNFNWNSTLENFVPDTSATNAFAKNENGYSTDAANIKDVRPVEDIAFDYVAAEDKIFITPKPFLMPQLEKNMIEITVKGVEDKYGNRLASPASWTAFVHRNQVRWEDERRTFTKEIYKPMEFVATIKNTGGQQIGFTITNLPAWLTALPSSGALNPESTLEIKFTVNPAINIGEYNQDIILRTDNGFDEKLPLTVRVYKKPPKWNVDPSKFEATMNIVGVVKIEGILSTDIFDLVAAFKRGTDSIRGVNNVRYIPDFDSYLVFLNVYGNGIGEELEFRIWDASAGQIIDNVLPDNITFKPNAVSGNIADPIIFEGENLFRQYISLAKGWNWVSFNKLASNQNNLNSFFKSLKPSQNDQVKSHGIGFNNYDKLIGWNIGGIDSIDNRRMYQIKISNADTIVYSGSNLNPEETPITLTAGWNHVGYLPDLSMDINDALRLYVAGNSEVIKSQFAFSMFDNRVGWIGTLDLMQPGLGYMLKSSKNATLTYPNNTVFKRAKVPHYTSPPLGWGSNLAEYEGNISVVARLDFTNMPELKVNSDMVLGSFINKECHGFISPLRNSDVGYEPFFLTVSNSENGQIVGFRLYDGLTGNSYSITETVPFVADAVYGTTSEPLVLTLKSLITGEGGLDNTSFIRCYPNPFDEKVNVEFAGTDSHVTIEVVNTTGSLIQCIYNGNPVSGINTAVWDGTNRDGKNVSAGMFYIRFISGETVNTVKISKTR